MWNITSSDDEVWLIHPFIGNVTAQWEPQSSFLLFWTRILLTTGNLSACSTPIPSKSFLIQHAVFTSLWKPLGIRQERQRNSTPSVSLELQVLTQRCTKMATGLILGAINSLSFLNTMKTNTTFGKMLYIRLQNSVKHQTFPRYFYVIYLPRVYLGKYFIHFNISLVPVLLFLAPA